MVVPKAFGGKTAFLSGWWFGTFFPYTGNKNPNWLPYIGNNHPNWLIFFKMVKTTNQRKHLGVKQHSYGYLEGPGSFKQILRFLSQEELMQGQRGPQAQMEQVAAGFPGLLRKASFWYHLLILFMTCYDILLKPKVDVLNGLKRCCGTIWYWMLHNEVKKVINHPRLGFIVGYTPIRDDLLLGLPPGLKPLCAPACIAVARYLGLGHRWP